MSTSSVSKDKLLVDKVALGPGVRPTPLKYTDWGLPSVSSMIVMTALRGPVWAGVKVTVMAQLAPAPRLAPQVVVWLNCAASFVVMLAIATSEVTVFVRVSTCVPLALPTISVSEVQTSG